jgi:nicotinamide-nucleotide amidase
LRSLDVGILIVGDEILQGFTVDTNSSYLSRRLRQMGHCVRKIITVRDDTKAIVKDLRALVKEDLDLVFVCGGLGSTPDDVTLEAVSKALKVPLTTSRKALAWMRKKVKRLHAKGRLPDGELNEAHLKMALAPRGAKVFFNEPGAAPGMVLSVRGGKANVSKKVIVLPGVPRELKYIFEEQLEGNIIRPTKDRRFFKELEVTIYESSMNKVLEKMCKENPDVICGSYPQDDHRVLLRISGQRDKVLKAVKKMEKELDSLEGNASK